VRARTAQSGTDGEKGASRSRLRALRIDELDWIMMKALEKDRNRRYESASGFAADVQRYLADEPVQACPPSARYRFRKFARRNKAALARLGDPVHGSVAMLSQLQQRNGGVGGTFKPPTPPLVSPPAPLSSSWSPTWLSPL